MPGFSATATAAAWANSLPFPTMNVSKMYFEFILLSVFCAVRVGAAVLVIVAVCGCLTIPVPSKDGDEPVMLLCGAGS